MDGTNMVSQIAGNMGYAADEILPLTIALTVLFIAISVGWMIKDKLFD